MQVPDAAGAIRIPSSNVNTALDKVRDGSADAAMVPIENSVEGGVTATLDAIATGQELRIIREALVPISFVLVARPGVEITQIRRISTHGHAWAQCRLWVDANIPGAEYIPGSSTAAAAHGAPGGRRRTTTPRSARRSSHRNSPDCMCWRRTSATTPGP